MDIFSGPSPHRPLSATDPAEIRLVKLYPGEYGDPVRCVLQHVSLDSCPDFIALSYVWGDPTVTSPIILNGQMYSVTTNLKSFLQHIQALLIPAFIFWRHHTYPSLDLQQTLQLYLRNCPNDPPQAVRSDTDSQDNTSWESSIGSDDRYSPVEGAPDQLEAPLIDHQQNSSFSITEDDGLYLWIDAISINQQDISERNHQVYRMGDIYSSASCLFVWLGDCEFTPKAADITFEFFFEVLRHISGKEVPLIDHEPMVYEATRVFIEDVDKFEAEFQQELMSLTKEEIRNREGAATAIAYLLDLPWFKRAWIIQEFVLCKGPSTVWYGFHHIPWITLCLIGAICKQYLLPIYGGQDGKRMRSLSPPYATILLRLSEWYRDYQTREELGSRLSSVSLSEIWLEILEISRSYFNATDPRDLIYALQGLLPRTEIPLELRPDYQLPIAQIFRRCAIYLLEHSCNGLNFILSAKSAPLDMPAWVPDWATFNPSIDCEPKTLAVPTVHDNGGRLAVDGIYLARVSLVVKPRRILAALDEQKSLSDLIPSVRLQLILLENKIYRGIIASHPYMSREDFWNRWKTLWEINDEETLHDYNIIVGRKPPQPADLVKSVFDSRIIDLTDRIHAAEDTGIAILEDGHLVTNIRTKEPILESDIVFMVKGVCKPCIVRQNGLHYRFCGMCSGSTYKDNPDDEFYKTGKLERISLT